MASTELKDKWIKCLSHGGNIRATAIACHDLINEAQRRHKIEPTALKALGEALMAGILLSSTAKAGERVSLSVKGQGFLRQVVVDALPEGTVRGFVTTRDGTAKAGEEGPWHEGILSVVRLRLHEKEPYVGNVPAVTGHLAKDLTFYLSQSEQIPSAVGLAVNLNPAGQVSSAGAFMVQVLGGASGEEVKLVEKNIHAIESLAANLAENADPTLLLGQIFDDMTFTILEEKPLSFECNCSRERVVRALKLLGTAELKDMIAKDDGAKLHCDFCATEYAFDADDLKALIDEMNEGR